MAKLAKRALRQELKTIVRLLADSTKSPDDPVEVVHQLRVSSRRADVALRLLRHWLPHTLRLRMKESLNRIRDKAGAVRDLDLLKVRWQPAECAVAGASPDVEGWLQDRLSQQRDLCWNNVIRSARKSRRSQLNKQTAELIQSIRWRGHGKRPGRSSIRQTILPQIAKQFEIALQESSQSLQHSHQARIHGRRLRYALEILNDSLPSVAAELSSRLVEIQEVLGQINDDVAAAQFLEDAGNGCDDPDLVSGFKQLQQQVQFSIGTRTAQWGLILPDHIQRIAELLDQIIPNHPEDGHSCPSNFG